MASQEAVVEDKTHGARDPGALDGTAAPGGSRIAVGSDVPSVGPHDAGRAWDAQPMRLGAPRLGVSSPRRGPSPRSAPCLQAAHSLARGGRRK
jgi:hypothetical protein